MSFDEEHRDEHDECRHEIESLRAQLAEVTRERNELRELSVTNIMVAICPGEDGMGEEVYARSLDDVFAVINRLSEKAEDVDSFRVQLLTTQAHAARLVEALGEAESAIRQLAEECDGDYEFADELRAALSIPINLDALHEDRARTLEGAAKNWIYGSTFNTLNEMAAANRAKKEVK